MGKLNRVQCNYSFRFSLFALLFALLFSSCTTGMMNAYLGLFGYDLAMLEQEQKYARDYSGMKGGIHPGTGDVSLWLQPAAHPRAKAVSADMLAAARKDPRKNLPVLVGFLTEGMVDPFEKVQVIHDWVIFNTVYDYQALNTGRFPDQSYVGVCASGKGVCAGYSSLFKAMCEMADIRCQIVGGYGRGINYDPSKKKEKIEFNHDWNAVLVGDGWYLVDATWDSNYLSSAEDYSNVWLLAHPQAMIMSHYPGNEAWQLLAKPLSEKAFLAQPDLNPSSCRIFKRMPEDLKRFYSVKGEYELILPPVNPGYSLIASLITEKEDERMWKGEKLNNSERRTYLEYREDSTAVRIIFREKGNHILRLSWTQSGNADSAQRIYQSFGTLGFKNSRKSDKQLPTECYPPYRGFHLLSPLFGPLKEGDTVPVHLLAPGVETVYFNGLKGYEPFAPAGPQGEFRFDVTIPAGYGERNTHLVFYRDEGKTKQPLIFIPMAKKKGK